MSADCTQSWYHGSPLKLSSLRPGSTITPDRHLAAVFSHKPTIVSLEDDGALRHNGTTPGYLYRVAEEVAPADVHPHPRSSMPPGLEWLTARELRLELIGPTEILPAEQLTGDEVHRLLAGHPPAWPC